MPADSPPLTEADVRRIAREEIEAVFAARSERLSRRLMDVARAAGELAASSGSTDPEDFWRAPEPRAELDRQKLEEERLAADVAYQRRCADDVVMIGREAREAGAPGSPFTPEQQRWIHERIGEGLRLLYDLRARDRALASQADARAKADAAREVADATSKELWRAWGEAERAFGEWLLFGGPVPPQSGEG